MNGFLALSRSSVLLQFTFTSIAIWRTPNCVITTTIQSCSLPLLISNVISSGRAFTRSTCSSTISAYTISTWSFTNFPNSKTAKSKWWDKTWRNNSKCNDVQTSCSVTFYSSSPFLSILSSSFFLTLNSKTYSFCMKQCKTFSGTRLIK